MPTRCRLATGRTTPSSRAALTMATITCSTAPPPAAAVMAPPAAPPAHMISTRSSDSVSAPASTPAAITQINHAGTTPSWHERVSDASRLPGCCRHEVDQLLDGTQQRHLDVGVAVDAREHPAPHLAGVADSECGADAVLPVHVARHVGPPLDAQCRRLHGLPYVDVRMPGHLDDRLPK